MRIKIYLKEIIENKNLKLSKNNKCYLNKALTCINKKINFEK